MKVTVDNTRESPLILGDIRGCGIWEVLMEQLVTNDAYHPRPSERPKKTTNAKDRGVL
jgi:hypothetical protein